MSLMNAIRAVLERHDPKRPHDAVTCEVCGELVPRNAGHWDANYGELLCGSAECEERAAATRSW
ncbi:hypothetical protein [Curtobacterium sp. Curtsp57]|uniref:hypothetical protein n=1 Tax=Curtobacterium sp. Curtsp57 TaxID=3243047 RepID=UPI0039B48B6F